MVLDFGQDFFGGGLFKDSPEDDQVWTSQGSRQIPGTLLINTNTENTNGGTFADDATVGTKVWQTPDNAEFDDDTTTVVHVGTNIA